MSRPALRALLLSNLAALACSKIYAFDEFRFAPTPSDAPVADVEDAVGDDSPAPDTLAIEDRPTLDARGVDAGAETDATAGDVLPPVDAGICAAPVAVTRDISVCRTLGCPDALCATPDLHAVAGTDLEHLWAVGQYNAVYSFNGRAWLLENIGPADETLRAVLPFPGGVWAVGDRGVILARVGSTWLHAQSPTTYDLHDLAGTPSGFGVWAVGDHGTLLTTNSGSLTSWQRATFASTVNLATISVFGDFGIMLSTDGLIYRRLSASATWMPIVSAPIAPTHPTDVHAYGNTLAWISTDRGLFRFSGAVATQVAATAPRDLASVWGDATRATALIRRDSNYVQFSDGTANVIALETDGLEALGAAGPDVLVGVGALGGVHFFRGLP